MGIENRKTPRYPYRSQLDVVVTSKRAAMETARAVNLSLGGICFEHPVPIHAHDKIRIRMPLRPEPIEVTAEVRHATRVSTEIGGEELEPLWLVGAQFSAIDYVQQKRLEQTLVQLAKAQSGRDAADEDDDL